MLLFRRQPRVLGPTTRHSPLAAPLQSLRHQLRVQGLAESLLTVATLYSMKGWADGSPPDTHLVSRCWQVFLRVRTGFLPPEGMFSDGGWTLAWLSALCPSQHL